MIAPALYSGTLTHRRHYPTPHAFSYSLFMSLLDIDRLDDALAVSRWTSLNRFNWTSFHERDHIGGPGVTLRQRLDANAASSGHRLPTGRIVLLTHLRYLHYVFNPISIYYCHDRAGRIRLVMADVRNTYRGRHQYWLTPDDDADHRFRSTVAKALFVSPFMRDDMDYEFILTPPRDRLIVQMNVTERSADRRRHFDASLTLTAQPWTARGIRRALIGFPFMTAKVIAAIHWEAMRLRWKGLEERSPEAAS